MLLAILNGEAAMAFSTPQSGLFLAAGQANQFSISFGTNWPGPQFFTAREDRHSGGNPAAQKILLLQWQGTGLTPRGLGPPEVDLFCGVANNNDSDIWFHFEGGGVT